MSKKQTSIVVPRPPDPPTLIPVAVKFNPLAIKEAEDDAATELETLKGLTIDDDEDAAAANVELQDWTRKLKAVDAMLASVLEPLQETEERIRLLFGTARAYLGEGATTLRRLLEGYALAKRQAHRAALEAAAQAATLPTAAALTTALQAAEDAAPTKLEGTSFSATWRVLRIAEGLLPFNPESKTGADHFWAVDMKKIEAVGRKHKGDKPPVIPGVIWQEIVRSTVRT